MARKSLVSLLGGGLIIVSGILGSMTVFHQRSSASGPMPETGQIAPVFSGTDQHGVRHSLTDYKGRWLVLYFFPKADTPGCTKEACSFRDGIRDLKDLGASVVGVSMDNQGAQEHFAKKFHIPFPLLADDSGVIAKRFSASGGFLGFDHRYTFLISPDGRIVKRYLDVDPDRHTAQVIGDLKEIEHSASKSHE